MGPGSNPSWHEHSKPPTTLVQVPLPHGFPMEHSSVSGEDGQQGQREEVIKANETFIVYLRF